MVDLRSDRVDQFQRAIKDVMSTNQPPQMVGIIIMWNFIVSNHVCSDLLRLVQQQEG